MKPVIAITSPGSMGAAIGGRLTAHGIKVLTNITGRSAASRQRAEAHGLTGATEAELAGADFLLSVAPPKEALAIAEALAPALGRSGSKPVYVDCNAVSPETAMRIGRALADTGARYVDGGIIGGPPREGYTPRLYVSGPEASRVEDLNRYGLDVRLVEGGIGAASALKLSYAGINKGMIGIGAAMVLAARRAGVEDALMRELTESQRALLSQLSRGVPDMFSKAERWAPEMEEIANYAGPGGEAEIYSGLARFYERLAQDFSEAQDETGALDEFFRGGRKAAE
jgi:3-hydroxyisobutyrate dehydrogenase-like beta-hydroxyacid dehydrogenase